MLLFSLFLFFVQSSGRSKSQEQYPLQTSSLLFGILFTVRSLIVVSDPPFDLTNQNPAARVRRAHAP